PPAGSLNRWLVLVAKSFVLIPHGIVLALLALPVFVVTVVAWFAVLVTGRYPRGLFGFVAGITRWRYRSAAYLASFTDHFPPYSLEADAHPGARVTFATSAVVGGLVTGALAVTLFLAADTPGTAS